MNSTKMPAVPPEPEWKEMLSHCYLAIEWALRKRRWHSIDDTLDLAQETALDLHTYLLKNNVRVSRNALIRTIANRNVARFIRRQMHSKEAREEYLEKVRPNAFVQPYAPDEFPAARRRLFELVRARLPPTSKDFFDCYMQSPGSSFVSLSKQLKIKPETARQRACRLHKTILEAHHEMVNSLCDARKEPTEDVEQELFELAFNQELQKAFQLAFFLRLVSWLSSPGGSTLHPNLVLGDVLAGDPSTRWIEWRAPPIGDRILSHIMGEFMPFNPPPRHHEQWIALAQRAVSYCLTLRRQRDEFDSWQILFFNIITRRLFSVYDSRALLSGIVGPGGISQLDSTFDRLFDELLPSDLNRDLFRIMSELGGEE
jgi:DNA-directed RNA polymerase specialized sigma24 family protein